MFTQVAIIIIILLISLYIWSYYQNESTQNSLRSDAQPIYDIFSAFTDLSHVERDNINCRPYFIYPYHSDNQSLYKANGFSCHSGMENLAVFSPFTGLLTINSSFSSFELANCTITSINSNGNITKPIQLDTQMKIDYEYFCIKCFYQTGLLAFLKTFVNFSPIIKSDRIGSLSTNKTLQILAVRGLSQNQASRHLRTTLDFLNKNNFTLFSLYNLETSDNDQNIRNIIYDKDDEKPLWDYYEELGCSTFLYDDYNNNTKRILTNTQNLTIYPKDYHSFNKNQLIFTPHCMIDGRVNAEDYLSIWRDFSMINPSCSFGFAYLTEITEYNDWTIEYIDEALRKNLESMVNLFETTTIAILSDGGNADSDSFNTLSGRAESKNGFFAIRLADYIDDKLRSNLKENSDRLITSRQIHSTFVDLAGNTSSDSLLRTILPNTLNCSMVGVGEDNCLCSQDDGELGEQQLKNLLDSVNQQLSTQKCLNLDATKIESSQGIPRIRTTENPQMRFIHFNSTAQLKPTRFSNSTQMDTMVIQISGRAQLLSNQFEIDGGLQLINTSCANSIDSLCQDCYYSVIHSTKFGK